MQSIEERIETRIRAFLLKHDEPIKVRDLQLATANRSWAAVDFRGALNELIRRGVVWHDSGLIVLIDRTPLERTDAVPLLNSRDLGITRPD